MVILRLMNEHNNHCLYKIAQCACIDVFRDVPYKSHPCSVSFLATVSWFMLLYDHIICISCVLLYIAVAYSFDHKMC